MSKKKRQKRTKFAQTMHKCAHFFSRTNNFISFNPRTPQFCPQNPRFPENEHFAVFLFFFRLNHFEGPQKKKITCPWHAWGGGGMCFPGEYILQKFPLIQEFCTTFLSGLFAQSGLSLIHISEPTRQPEISYDVFCLK